MLAWTTVADWILVQGVCQVDTVRGWQYLDDAGKVMNAYDEVFEAKTVTTDGLRMGNPRSGAITQAQVTPKMIWAAFELPDTPKLVIDQSAKFVSRVAELIHVVSARRLAIRIAYLVPLAVKEIDDLVASGGLFEVAAIEGTSLKADKFEVTLVSKVPQLAKDASATLRLQQATRSAEAPQKYPESGLMIDLDVYREVESPEEIPLADYRKFLADAAPWIDQQVAAVAHNVRSRSPRR